MSAMYTRPPAEVPRKLSHDYNSEVCSGAICIHFHLTLHSFAHHSLLAPTRHSPLSTVASALDGTCDRLSITSTSSTWRAWVRLAFSCLPGLLGSVESRAPPPQNFDWPPLSWRPFIPATKTPLLSYSAGLSPIAIRLPLAPRSYLVLCWCTSLHWRIFSPMSPSKLLAFPYTAPIA